MSINQLTSLNQFNCVITGAGGAVGSAIADYLYSKGAAVIGTKRGSTVKLEESADRRFSVTVDLVDRKAVDMAVDAILKEVSAIHAWINVAGGFRMGTPVNDLEHGQIHMMMQINFFTALNGCQAVVDHMNANGFGRIVNFGAAAVESGLGTALPYIISKAAVQGLTLTLAQEVQPGVTCNIVIPTTIDTPANRKAMPDADVSDWTSPMSIAETVGELLLSTKNGEKIFV